MMKVSPLVGIKSYFALQAYGKVLLGLKMIPEYMALGFAEFFQRVEELSEADQEAVIRQGVFIMDLDSDEVYALAKFVTDPNGVPYGEANMKTLPPDQIFEILVAVCKELARIKPKLITPDEKKKSVIGQSTSEVSL